MSTNLKIRIKYLINYIKSLVNNNKSDLIIEILLIIGGLIFGTIKNINSELVSQFIDYLNNNISLFKLLFKYIFISILIIISMFFTLKYKLISLVTFSLYFLLGYILGKNITITFINSIFFGILSIFLLYLPIIIIIIVFSFIYKATTKDYSTLCKNTQCKNLLLNLGKYGLILFCIELIFIVLLSIFLIIFVKIFA